MPFIDSSFLIIYNDYTASKVIIVESYVARLESNVVA